MENPKRSPKKSRDGSEEEKLLEDILKKELPSGWTKTSLAVREEYFEKLKALAYWERVQLKDIFDELLEKFVSTLGDVKPIPKERKKILK